MADIKETLISTMENGQNVLEELRMARVSGGDFISTRGEVDRKLSELHPEKLSLVLVEAEMVTPTARRLRLCSEDGYLPPFEAGMYINLFVGLSGIRTSRPYSISSSPSDRGYYEITVEEVPDGFVSTYLVRDAKVGDVFEAVGPAGYFHDNPVFHSPSKVFIAGGSGVTPFCSMVRETLEKNLDRRIVLFHGIRTLGKALYHDMLSDLAEQHPNFRYVPVLSDESRTGFENGFVTKELISRYVDDPPASTYYLCGPEVMVSFCIGELGAMGIPVRRIRRELFGSRRDIWNESLWPSDVPPDASFEMKVDGRSFRVKASQSILSALECNGIRVGVCCRSGECSLCRVRLVSGQVFNAPGVLLRYADVRFGYIHSCKAYPISDIEIGL